MMSLVSVVAARKGVDLKGMRVLARAAESSKGIEKIELKVIMPLEGSHPLRAMLEKTALSCPVRQALRPDLETPIEWGMEVSSHQERQPKLEVILKEIPPIHEKSRCGIIRSGFPIGRRFFL